MKLCELPAGSAQQLGFSEHRLKGIDALIQSSVDRGLIPGAAVVVCRAGKIAHSAAFGYQDIDRKVPLTVDSLFRLYSQTKPMVAALVMRLFEQGRISLDMPITTFLPEFSNRSMMLPRSPSDHVHGAWSRKIQVSAVRDITIRDLLTMTSGLSAGFEDVPAAYRPVLDRIWSGSGFVPTDLALNEPVGSYEESMLAIATLPLSANPGTKWSYGVDYEILSLLLTRMAGCDLGQLLRTELFEPLGLNDTSFYCSAENSDRLTTEYAWNEAGSLVARDPPETAEKVVNPKRNLMSGNGLYGGLLTSPADYCGFLLTLLGGGMSAGNQVLGRKSIEQMLADHIPWGSVDLFTGPGYGFGYGVAVRRTLAGSHLPGSVGEFTWGGAGGTTFFVDPSEDLIGLFFTHVFGYQFNPQADLYDQFKARVFQALI